MIVFKHLEYAYPSSPFSIENIDLTRFTQIVVCQSFNDGSKKLVKAYFKNIHNLSFQYHPYQI